MSDLISGFGSQGLTGMCGVYSLSHALLVAGIPLNRDIIKKKVGFKGLNIPELKKNNWDLERVLRNWGTGENGIIRAIQSFGFKESIIQTCDEDLFVKKVTSALQKGSPVIISNQEYGHWVSVVGKKNNKYIIVDSAYSDYLIGIHSESSFIDYCYNDFDSDDQYIFYGITFNASENSSSVKNIHRSISKLIQNKVLRQYWGFYLELLLEYFEHDNKRLRNKVLLYKHLSKKKQSLVNYLSRELGNKKSEISEEVNNLQEVARAYNLVIREKELEYFEDYMYEIIEYVLEG